MWYVLYEEESGVALSEGTVLPGPAPGQAVASFASRPEAQDWDHASRTFVARPAKVFVDRLQDLANDPELSAVWTRLTVTQRQALRDRLARLLGRRRYRRDTEPVDMEQA